LPENKIICGDALETLKQLPDECIQTCVTSPPYWGLRDYGVDGQIGLEPSIDEYVANLVGVFEEVRRVLKNNGTLWLNLGDSYSHGGCGGRDPKKWPKQSRNDHLAIHKKKNSGLKPKDLCGIPWRVAFALQAAGWYLRSDIIWYKPNPMPESVTDRPTKAHEYLFLLTKSEQYYYDADAIREIRTSDEDANGFRGGAYTLNETFDNSNGGKRKTKGNYKIPDGWDTGKGSHGSFHRNGREKGKLSDKLIKNGRNKRSVWTIPTFGFPEAHFATFPPALIEPCILAGARAGDPVLDPFAGSGTTGEVSIKLGRRFIGIDLNEQYVKDLAAPRVEAAVRGQSVSEMQAGQEILFEREQHEPTKTVLPG
jgi:DNA modification methylase